MKKILAILLVAMLLLANAALAETGRIGVSMPTRSVERWIHDGDKVKESLEEKGYTVDLQYAEDIVDAQVSQIENMLLKGVDRILTAYAELPPERRARLRLFVTGFLGREQCEKQAAELDYLAGISDDGLYY